MQRSPSPAPPRPFPRSLVAIAAAPTRTRTPRLGPPVAVGRWFSASHGITVPRWNSENSCFRISCFRISCINNFVRISSLYVFTRERPSRRERTERRKTTFLAKRIFYTRTKRRISALSLRSPSDRAGEPRGAPEKKIWRGRLGPSLLGVLIPSTLCVTTRGSGRLSLLLRLTARRCFASSRDASGARNLAAAAQRHTHREPWEPRLVGSSASSFLFVVGIVFGARMGVRKGHLRKESIAPRM